MKCFRYQSDAVQRTRTRAGLSLLELLIVLVILTALTGIAVQSLEPIAEQARYQATQQTLVNVEEAIVSRTLTPERVASYSGFVADIGRLPLAVGTDPETQLVELWNHNGLPPFSITDFDDADIDNELTIPVAAGWRGPYLLLPPGPSILRDGFGRPFGVVNSTDAEAADGDIIANLVSSGANGTINALDEDYDRDLELPGGIWTPARYEGAVTVSVKESDGLTDPALTSGQTLRVRFYGPENGAAALLAEQDTTGTGTVAFSPLISGEPVGPRVLVAYVTTGTAPSLTVVRQSAPMQIVVAPGMNPTVQLKLP